MYKRSFCSHGHREADWLDPATGRLLDPPPLSPTLRVCHGCAEEGRYLDAIRTDNAGGAPLHGYSVIMVPLEEAIAAEEGWEAKLAADRERGIAMMAEREQREAAIREGIELGQ